MGYTHAEKSLAMDCTSYLNGGQSVNTTAETLYTRVSLPVSALPPVPEKHAVSSEPVRTKDADIPQLKMKGGFYKAGAGRKQLFLAGRLFKQRTRRNNVRGISVEIALKQIAGAAV